MTSGTDRAGNGRPRPGRVLETLWAAGALGAIGLAAGLFSCERSSPAPANPAPPAKASPSAAAPSAATGATGEAEVPAGPQGWQAVFATAGAPAEQAVKSHAPSASFALAAGESLDPLVAPAGLSAGYTGVVQIDQPGRYRFGANADGGSVKLTAYDSAGARVGEASGAGAVWTPWVSLKAAPVTVAIQYTRAGDAPARMRALWEKEGVGVGFRAEPIPPYAVSVPRFGQRDTAAADSALHGRVLLGELNCTSCHDAGEKGAMAVLRRQAPLLGEIGRRASPEWLLHWVTDPQKVKPGSGMPDVIGDSPQDRADADAIVHYLVSLGGPTQWEAAATEPQSLAIGRKLFHTVGCITCHGPQEAPSAVFDEGPAQASALPDFKPPQPYGDLAGKWRPAALSEFLRDPARTHPGGRMPSLSLTQSESDAIATYLVSAWGQSQGAGNSGFTVEPAKVEVGKAAFSARGCAACHQTGHSLPDLASTLKAKPLSELTGAGGCLSESHAGSPRYTLGADARRDLAAGIDAVKRVIAAASPAPAPIDQGRRLIAALGCMNCHSKDEAGGVPDSIKPYFHTVDETELGDEGRFPPHLTGVGMKLNPQWMKAVLTEGGRARPYMATRMPQFGAKEVGQLHTMLAAMDGITPGSDDPEPQATDALVLAGRRLVGEKGMNCISCHSFDGRSAGTAGPDITGFAERLRYEWWKPYIMAPTRFKPGTRMTEFYKDGKGAITDVFGGDPDTQSQALWAYFTTGEFGPAPEGLPTGKGLPVALGERPAVFRTFLKSAGSRGIAVGFPIGTHFGFDAAAVRLVDAWQGDFIDATSAWKGRGGEIAGGQGHSLWKAPAGPALVIGERPATWPSTTGRDAGYAFKGYRLDSAGVPTFLYRIGEAEVQERFEPAAGGGITRTFEISGLPAGATVWLNTGPGVTGSTVLANVAEDKAAGDDKMHLHGYTAKEAGKPVSFSVVIKP